MSMMKEKKWAVIGAGNGGQAVAGHLALLGQTVRIFDVVRETVDEINRRGGISVSHALSGFGKIEFATCEMEEALNGADNVMIVLPSIHHESIAAKCAPFLRDGQVVLLHPEASCGALAFRKALSDAGCRADITLGAVNTLLYSCRSVAPGDVYIYGIKKEVQLAAMPASRIVTLSENICSVLPWMKPVANVLVTSLSNPNAMMHPAPMLLNTSRLESNQPFEYYHEGITPSIGRFIENMDRERLALGEAFGLRLDNIRELYVKMYGCDNADTPLYQICRNNPSYEGIMAGDTLRTRYVLEDIPYSLRSIQSLAHIAGVETPHIDTIVSLAEEMLPGEIDEGRTEAALGIAGMSPDQLLGYIG